MTDFIKDNDQHEMIVRIFYLEDLQLNGSTKYSSCSIFIPVHYYMNKTKINRNGNNNVIENIKKLNLFLSTLNLLDNLQSYLNNISIKTKISFPNSTYNMGIITEVLDSKFNLPNIDIIQSELSNALFYYFNNLKENSYSAEKFKINSLNFCQEANSKGTEEENKNKLSIHQVTLENLNNNIDNNTRLVDLSSTNYNLNKTLNDIHNPKKDYVNQTENIENLRIEPNRKSTIQINEIGNRNSFSTIGDMSEINQLDFYNVNPLNPLLNHTAVLDNDNNINTTIINNNLNFTTLNNANSNIYSSLIQSNLERKNPQIPNQLSKNQNNNYIKIEEFKDMNNSELDLLHQNNLTFIDTVKHPKITYNQNLNHSVFLPHKINIKQEYEQQKTIDSSNKKEDEAIFKILDKKKEELNGFLNRDWIVMEEKNGFKSYYYDEPNGLRSIKATITFNKNVNFIYEYLDNLEKITTYDKNFDYGRILRKIDEFHEIRYLKFKGKIMITPRDFIVILRKIIVKIYL